ncbi:MAG: type I polyketide synthase, partial [Chthoniobacterales bacterium]
MPATRWNAARFYHANAEAPGRMVTRWGGFVEDADKLDAAFFGIAPREAACLDPQHRWLLETTWEACEDAGWPPEKLSGTRTGVFIGISHSDYPNLHRNDAGSIDRYTNIGSAFSIAANRISYLLNLRGPSFAVDTACSSSLMALHLAARSLGHGDCDYALVGGANAVLSPEGGIGFSQAHMLSPRGRCRAFDASADGYVRAEGAAMLLLMSERKARELGLQPRALLVSTAANQDGRSTGGLTVPSQKAQEAMMREALASAGLEARDIVYLEAHGTGTPVGDPIEARAIANVLGAGRAPNERLLVGSVKTNIGHLEPASGVAGLIKAILVLEHRAVPPSLHFEEPNPRLPLDRLSVPTALTPLPVLDAARTPLVGVNSFGFGGANVHALLTPAPPVPEEVSNVTDDEPRLFVLSARSPEALAEYATAYAGFIDREGDALSLRDLCAATALGKSHHPLRRGVVADSLSDLRKQLAAAQPPAAPAARPKIAFIFSGQGPQWWAMGRGLYEREKIVREFWERCDAICRAQGGPNLLNELLAAEAASRLNQTEIAQPALFALQGGLVELWRAWGIEPDAVLGHSVGEAAAAWAAGLFDLEEIFRVILARSRAQATTRGQGRMLAASISADEARDWEQRFPGRISLAAINAPRQVTLSGDVAALEEIVAGLEQAKIFRRLLATEYPFHSAQMDPLEAGLRAELADIEGHVAKAPAMISTVTGELVRGPELDATYWWRNVRQPVRFADGVARLLRDGCTAFVEIGPHPVMAAALTEIALAEKLPTLTVASLRRAEDEPRTMLHALGALYQHGAAVRWEALHVRPPRALRLPAYPWQRQHLWHEAHDVTREFRSAAPHPLLGDRQPHPQPVWFGQLDARLLPWLNDHRLTGSAVVPAAAYLEMAAAAVREFLGEATVFLEDIRFHHLLFLPEGKTVASCVRLNPAVSSFQILTARPDAPDEWELQAEGLYRPGRLHAPPPGDLAAIREVCPDEHDPAALYTQLDGIGQVYGPTFRGLHSLRLRNHEEVLAGIRSTGGEGAS